MRVGCRWLLFWLLVVPARAVAQPAESTAPAPPPPTSTPPSDAQAAAAPVPATPEQPAPTQVCTPRCRAGFICNAGSCVSACNPACSPGYECVEGGRCIPSDASALKRIVREAIDEYLAEQRAEYRAKTVYHHDGWYLRLGFNAGYAWDSAERGEASTTSRGAGGFIEYALGGSVSNHLVFAVAHHPFGVFSPTTRVRGESLDADHSAFYQVVGALFDYYPDPTKGWHVTTTLGWGFANIQVRDDEATELTP